MFIQTEQTPNPATMKFLPGRTVLAEGNAEFLSADEALSSPLAQRLFCIEGVERVFFGGDFISVTRTADSDWMSMKTSVLAALMEHFTAGLPVVTETLGNGEGDSGPMDEISLQIREILDTRIRPAVAQDGGDITFVRFSDGVVYLRMKGACSGCPSSTITLKMGIENTLRHFVPEVARVEALDPDSY